MRVVRLRAFAWASVLLLALASPAAAQSGGFVYALDQVNGAPNQIFGFSVNPATGVLSALGGFPVSTGGNGGAGSFSQHLFYDRLNSRLYAINESSATLSAFTVNRLTGALAALPFSPVTLPAAGFGCVAVDATGSVLAAAGGAGVATFLITESTATAAPGSPFATPSASAFGCAFSQDGAYFYSGGNVGNAFAGFAVNPATAALTPLAGSPFDTSAGNPVGYATDASGRVFVSNFGSGLRAFTTTAGIPAAATGNPFASGLSGGVQALVTPAGFYMVADRSANKVGVFRIGGAGTATTLTAVAGSPFASGGTFTDALAQDQTGTLLFAANGTSRNITTFRVATVGTALTSLTTQAANAVGAGGLITGLAFAPPVTGGFVYALNQVNGGANQVYGFSLNTSTGALTALPGFPVSAGTGGAGSFSEHMTYDRLNGRLYVVNEVSSNISGFAVNRSSGALTPLPFSPITLPAADWACVAVSPDGGVVAAAGSVGIASFKIGASTATAAAGNPFATGGASPFSCAFSQDGASFYTGGNVGNVTAGFAVNTSTGAMTALAGSPFNTGGANPVGYATDTSGRLFVSNFGTGVRAFTTASGIPSPVSGNPFASGLSGGVAGTVTSSGFYVVADRSGNRVGSYAIGGAGAATTLTAAAGSPFATGGSFSATIDSDDTGSLVFVGNGSSRNLTVFNLTASGTLTSLGVQAANTLGAGGTVTGVAFAPRVTAASSEVTSAGAPRGITSGPDGNVWFTEISGNKIGRITTAGVITEFPTPSASGPDGITTGPDGNLWYAGFNGNKIGRVTTAGVITEFAAGAASGPALIATGPDGNLWFTEFSSHKIGRMTPAGALTEFSAGITALAQPYGITAGPDGNLWFTESAANKIARITTAGAVTEFPLPTPNSFPAAIVAGPDGALWFAETGTTGTANRIGRITTGGAITEFGGLSAGPGGITVGPDNNLWFSTGTGVGRITPLGVVTEYTPATSPIGSSTFPAFITSGADGNIWFAEQANNKIGLVVVQRFGLSVAKAGTGTGTVTSAPASLNCGATCGAMFSSGAVVVLTAAPAAGSRFVGWSGSGCTGTGTCTVSVDSASLVTATFAQQVTLTVTTVGGGTVTGNPGGISCGATCAAIYDSGTVVTLTATPASGLVFLGWTGGGCGSVSPCLVTVSAATPVTATFGFTLSPASVPNGIVGDPYSQTLTPSGGTAPHTFVVSSGSLPAGIALSSAGVLSGTPTAVSSATGFTVVATDAAGNHGTASYTIAVTPTPTVALSRSTLNFGAVNPGAGTWTVQTPSQRVSIAQAGVGPVTWTASANQPWITVSPTSGTVPAVFTVSVTNTGLPNVGTASGAVTVTTVGAANNPATAVNMAVLIGSSAAPAGVFDTPAAGATGLQGSLAVTGWAIDDTGIDRVEIWRDLQPGETTPPFASSPSDPRNGKVFISNATFVDDARPDVEALVPTTPLQYRAGWGYLLLTWGLWNQGNGSYTLYAYAFDQEGKVTTLGQKTIGVSNAAANRPFGSVDTPGIGGTVSGTVVNFGWGLTPLVAGAPSCTIGASGVQVSIDSGPLQPVVYGDARTDIAGAFSGFSNSAGAGGHFIFDTTALANGAHTIGWLITDDCSRADGVGSRFFNVQNGALVASAAETPASDAVVAAAPLAQLRAPVKRTDNRTAVTVAAGYGESAAVVEPDLEGLRLVHVAQGKRIEIHLPREYTEAYQLVNGDRRELPTGGTWDGGSATFYWQPAPAFLGSYDLVFSNGHEQIRVRVTVEAAGQ